MDQWLVRTSENWVTGPYLKEELCLMIQEGKLVLQDEVCPANGYWIFLHERDEVQKFLGVEVPRVVSEDEEDITETQSCEEEDVTDPDLNRGTTQSSLSQSLGETGNGIGTSSRATDEMRSTKKNSKAIHLPKNDSAIHGVGQMERLSLSRALAWFLVIVSGALVIILVRLFKR